MSIRLFIYNLFKKDHTKVIQHIQQENERLENQLHALEELKKELEKNHLKN